MVASVTSIGSKSGKDPIGKFLIDKIDGGVMRLWIKEHAGGFPFKGYGEDATDRQLAVAIAMKFVDDAAKASEPVEMLECDVCEGYAPDSLEACPFCGSAGEEPGLASVEEATHDEPPPTAAKPKASAKGAKKKKTKKDKPPAESVAEEKVIDMEAQAANGKSTNGKAAKKTAELVKVAGTGPALASTKATEKTLDKLVAEAKKFQGESFDSYVEFGKRILEIHDKRLWQLRVDEKGKAQYASFDAFVHHEFKVTPQYATALMKHAKEFTPEEQRVLGRSKMTLLLQAPPKDRAALKAETLANPKKLTKKKLAARVKETREKAGYKGETPQAQRASLSAKGKKPKVTAIANVEGKKTIKLYQRPPTIRNLSLDDLKRAKTLDAKPFGIIELANEMRIIVEVKKTESGLVLSYEFQRNGE
jgi:hypothetical protein